MLEQYLLQLMLTKGIGNAAIKKILKHTRTFPGNTLKDLCQNPESLTAIIKCKSDVIGLVPQNKDRAEVLLQNLQDQNISILIENDELYPKHLQEVLGEECPAVLFAKGNVKLLSTVAIGFCGSRKASPKGIGITAQCAEQLVNRHITIVSGYAAGTDLSAHTSAMMHGGNTVFVLAEGILKVVEKQAVRDYLTAANHVFVSQFLPQTTWNAGNAMKRNSVIIGLSRAMILVESGKSGGTFAAGEEALRRSQPLFVIDYSKPEVSAEANPYFIKRGGIPIRGNNNGIPNLEKVFFAAENDAVKNSEQLALDI